MERKVTAPMIAGAALLIIGIISLLQNFGLMGWIAATVWSIFFALGAAAFLAAFVIDRRAWWAAIPGSALLGIALTIAADELLPFLPDGLTGALFLGTLGLGFVVIFLAARERWWALIPGGVMLSLAATTVAADALHGPAAGGVLFLGLALTFGLVAFVPAERSLRWALIPAGVLGAMGVVTIVGSFQLAGLIWPAVLVGLGVALLLRGRRGGERGELPR